MNKLKCNLSLINSVTSPAKKKMIHVDTIEDFFI